MKSITITILTVLCCFIVSISHGQLSDLARVDYTILPAGSSDFEFNRTRFLFNYPIKLNDKQSYLFLGLDYSNINLFFEENIPFDRDELDGYQILDFNIGYTFKINEVWRFGARLTPGFSSNLTADDLSLDDTVISSDVVFIKDKKDDPTVEKPYRLILGASFSQNRGFPFPLPFISYYRKFHPNWSYNLGIPKTNIQYHFNNESHRLKAYAQLDGFTANIQGGSPVNGDIADTINMSLILSGLQYEFHFKKRFEFYIRGAYILDRNVALRNNDRDDIFIIDKSSGLTFRTALRIKI